MKKKELLIWLILAFLLPSTAFAGSWQQVASPNFPHHEHGAVLLDDGRVLIIGGHGNGSIQSSCEIFDPETGQWSLTGSLSIGRYNFGLVKLQGGRPLVIGGVNSGRGILKSCEVFDPIGGQWSLTDSLNIARGWYGSPHYNQGGTVLLSDGKVLIINGSTGIPTSSCEMFDPELEIWTLVAPTNQSRESPLGGLFSNGLVLSFHSNWSSGQGDPSVELYNPITDTWIYGQPPLPPQKIDESGIVIPEGYLRVGGRKIPGGSFIKNCEIYHTQTGEWTVTDSLPVPRICYAVTLLPNSKVLVSGGWDNNNISCSTTDCQIYSLESHTWSLDEPMNVGRANFTLTVLKDGRALAVGGVPIPSAEIYSWNTSPYVEDIDGPDQGYTNDTLYFLVTAIDDENDSISLRVDWGDGEISNWTEYQPTDYMFTFSHSWNNPGNYEIRFQPKDQWAEQQFHNSLGEWSEPFQIEITGVGIANEQSPAEPKINIYPNPFSSSVTISYSQEQREEKAKVQIFNVRGQLVRTLESSSRSGDLFWDGKDRQSKEVPTGVYILKVDGTTILKVVKMK